MVTSDRYLRHSMIDWFSQDDISQKRVAVVGAGAIGNEVIKNLALLGVGYIEVFDVDTIEIHNLTRSVLFRESDVGRHKAVVVAERANELDPSIEVHARTGDVWSTLSLADLSTYDILVCCVDNIETRIKLNQMCMIVGVNMVNAAIDSKFVIVETYDFATSQDNPCYECNLPQSAYTRMAQRYSCASLKKVAFVEKKVPTTIITSSLAGAFSTSLTLRFGGESVDRTPKRVMIDSFTGSTTLSELAKNDECPGCGRHPVRPLYLSARRDVKSFLSSCGDLMRVFEDTTLELSDPVIASYRCVSCVDASNDLRFLMKRASDFDDSITTCPTCGEKSVQIDIRDQFTVKELLENYRDLTLSCKYVRTVINETPICIELEGAVP